MIKKNQPIIRHKKMYCLKRSFKQYLVNNYLNKSSINKNQTLVSTKSINSSFSLLKNSKYNLWEGNVNNICTLKISVVTNVQGTTFCIDDTTYPLVIVVPHNNLLKNSVIQARIVKITNTYAIAKFVHLLALTPEKDNKKPDTTTVVDLVPTKVCIEKNRKHSLIVMNSVREMLKHSVYYGDTKCNPKNKIYTVKNNILNVFKTRQCLNKVLDLVTKKALKGYTFLFIGTKKSISDYVKRASYFTKNSCYVNTRWLGGVLTNSQFMTTNTKRDFLEKHDSSAATVFNNSVRLLLSSENSKSLYNTIHATVFYKNKEDSYGTAFKIKNNFSRHIAIIIDQSEDINAVRECRKLGIKTVTILDTNCDPTLSNHVIPANDDSPYSINFLLNKIITRIILAEKIRRVLK